MFRLMLERALEPCLRHAGRPARRRRRPRRCRGGTRAGSRWRGRRPMPRAESACSRSSPPTATMAEPPGLQSDWRAQRVREPNVVLVDGFHSDLGRAAQRVRHPSRRTTPASCRSAAVTGETQRRAVVAGVHVLGGGPTGGVRAAGVEQPRRGNHEGGPARQHNHLYAEHTAASTRSSGSGSQPAAWVASTIVSASTCARPRSRQRCRRDVRPTTARRSRPRPSSVVYRVGERLQRDLADHDAAICLHEQREQQRRELTGGERPPRRSRGRLAASEAGEAGGPTDRRRPCRRLTPTKDANNASSVLRRVVPRRPTPVAPWSHSSMTWWASDTVCSGGSP